MARTRRQAGLIGGVQTFQITIPNGAGPSTIRTPVIVPNDKAYIVSMAVNCQTAGTAGVVATLVLKDGSTALTTALSVTGATASAAATPAAGYEGSVEGVAGANNAGYTKLQEGDELSLLWTLVSGTNTAGAIYNVSVLWAM